MTITFRPLILSAMALGLAVSAVAQEAPPAPSPDGTPAPAPTESETVPPLDPAPAPTPAPAPAPAQGDAAPAAEAPAAPAMTPDQYIGNPEYMLNLDLSTGGRVVIQLYPNLAPQHVERVKQLARAGFYDGVKFHRVIDGFMAQTGDPTATGQGGSQLPDLKAEFNPMPHLRGTRPPLYGLWPRRVGDAICRRDPQGRAARGDVAHGAGVGRRRQPADAARLDADRSGTRLCPRGGDHARPAQRTDRALSSIP